MSFIANWILGPRGGHFLTDSLERLGIRHLFSVPGAQTLSVWDAIPGTSIDLVVPRSEWNAAFMAEGYGRACGAPAAVMNTVGPGVANEVMAMDSARAGEAPVLFVSPCHPPEKRDRFGRVFQGLDHLSFHGDIPKAKHCVDQAKDLAGQLESAYAKCMEPPAGPVRVEISFPLLFERHHFGTPPSRPHSPPAQKAKAILVRETASGGESVPPAWLGLPQEDCLVIGPGHRGAGHGIPYALGASFARPDTPTIALATPEALLDNADSVSLARFRGVPIHLVLRGPDEGSRVEAVARQFGADFSNSPNDTELRQIVLRDPAALSIVCFGEVT